MEYTYIRAVTSQVIVTAPGQVGAVIINPDGDDDRARLILYDGESASDPRIIMIRTLPGETKVTVFAPPLKLQRGLYIAFDSHVEEAIIQLQWKPE